MSASTEKLFKDIKEGKISPDQALEVSQSHSTQLGDIELEEDPEPLICGLPSIENLLILRKGKPDLVVVAARPGVGKTALVCQIALSVSKTYPILGYSLEMSTEQINKRMLAVESGKPINKLAIPANRAAVSAAQNRFKTFKFRLDGTNAIDINTLVSRTLDHKRKYPDLGLVFVDYLQIVHGSREYSAPALRIAEVVEKLKNLAKSISCPIVCAAQMSRALETRLADNPEASPLMADLSDGSSIEKWADMVLAMHRPHEDDVRVFVLKNRHGDSRDFRLGFSGTQTKFYDKGVIEDEI